MAHHTLVFLVRWLRRRPTADVLAMAAITIIMDQNEALDRWARWLFGYRSN